MNNFYRIVRKESGPASVHALIGLEKEHPIFKGHFPGNPVVPGVCMIQMVREVMEAERDIALRLVLADTIKFLAMINPGETPAVTLSLEFSVTENSYNISAVLFSEQTTYFKFKGLFAIV